MQVRWASVVVLAAVAWGAPSVETIELKVGQRVTLPIRPTVQVSLSDDAVVQASAQDDQTLALQGRVAGNSVLTVRDSQGKHTYLVRVAAVEPAAPAPVATSGVRLGATRR